MSEDVIVGGGMLGLVLALRLAQAGRRVTVLEAAPSFGGLAAPWSWPTPQGPVIWDRYYHVIAGGDAALLGLLDQLGLTSEIVWKTTRTNFFDGRGLYPLNNAWDFLRLPTLGLIDKLRLGATVLRAARIRDGSALEQLGAAEWLTALGGRNNWQRLWRPLLRAKLGENSEQASAAYVWQVIRRFYGAREGAARTERFGHVQGGYARVIEVLIAKLHTLGVELRHSTEVRAVRQQPDAGGFVVETDGAPLRCAHVILSCASPLAAALCAHAPAAERERLQALPYQGVVCASLLLTRPLGGAYLTYITDPQVPFTAVIEMSSLVERSQLGGHHLVYLPCYLPSEHADFALDDEAWRARFLGGLRRLFPDLQDGEIVAQRIARSRHVLALATRGYRSRVPAVRSALAGLFFVNSSQIVDAALSVDDTVRLAEASVPALLPA